VAEPPPPPGRDVGSIFAAAPAGPPERRCPSCGAVAATHRSACPACGKRYDRRAPWLPDRARWALGALAVAAVVVAAVLVLPGVFDARDERAAQAARAQARRVAAERVRLAREQTPHHGRATDVVLPPAGAPAAERIAARRAILAHLRADILADARARIAAGEIDGPVRDVECSALERRRGVPPPETVLGSPIGRYDCVAVIRDVMQRGKVVGTFGHPFVAAITWARRSYAWCKDNKVPSEGAKALASSVIPAECVGASGARRVGNGYAAPED
jgi:hypothetical protein